MIPVQAVARPCDSPPLAWRLVAAVCAALALWLAGSFPAHANRFGPPWQSRVVVDQAIVHTQPDPASPIVGPLPRDAIVAVLAEVKGPNDEDWTATPVGFLRSSDIQEMIETWVGEVAVPSVSVHAYPDAQSAIRRTAREGSLLRVTGLSPGLNGDTGIWWSTTEGFVALGTIGQSSSEWAQGWVMPTAADAVNGWWGTIASQSNVRAGATTDAPILGTFAAGQRVKVLAEQEGMPVGGNAVWYRIDGGRYAGAVVHSSLVRRADPPPAVMAPPPPDAPPGPYIVVNRPSATLSLVQDGQALFTTYVSLGRAGVDTPTGDYSTMGKYLADDMTSASVEDADHAYDLPNVPFTQYYKLGGFAIHGAYWHDNFGGRESQGCINLTYSDSAFLFEQTQPQVAEGDIARWIFGDQKATPVIIVG